MLAMDDIDTESLHFYVIIPRLASVFNFHIEMVWQTYRVTTAWPFLLGYFWSHCPILSALMATLLKHTCWTYTAPSAAWRTEMSLTDAQHPVKHPGV